MNRHEDRLRHFPTPKTKAANIAVTMAFLFTATAVSFFFFKKMKDPSSSISLCYILALFLTARYTTGYFYGVLSALISVG